jgi:hypothetical protein
MNDLERDPPHLRSARAFEARVQRRVIRLQGGHPTNPVLTFSLDLASYGLSGNSGVGGLAASVFESVSASVFEFVFEGGQRLVAERVPDRFA